MPKDLEQQTKAQLKSTGDMLKAGFSEHEESVRGELNVSLIQISQPTRHTCSWRMTSSA
ncbi:MbeB family mobilization protein [Enterobacter asburiae]